MGTASSSTSDGRETTSSAAQNLPRCWGCKRRGIHKITPEKLNGSFPKLNQAYFLPFQSGWADPGAWIRVALLDDWHAWR